MGHVLMLLGAILLGVLLTTGIALWIGAALLVAYVLTRMFDLNNNNR